MTVTSLFFFGFLLIVVLLLAWAGRTIQRRNNTSGPDARTDSDQRNGYF